MKQPPTDPLFSQSRASLSPLLPILTSFAHRNHNQHRASHWWSSFNILRRALRTLDDALLAGHGEPVRAHARWMTSHIVPRAYLTFTQLAADNQHAPLGLALLAILARVHMVLSDLVPSELSNSKPGAAAKPAAPRKAVANAEGEAPHLDMGVAVSRHDIASLARQTTSSSIDTSTPTDKQVKDRKPKDTKDTRDPHKVRKKKKKARDELSSLFGSLT